MESAQLTNYTVLLKDEETTATVYPVTNIDSVPYGLRVFLCEELNSEIETGTTLALEEPLDLSSFESYWMSGVTGIMLLGNTPMIEDLGSWEKVCLGTFYIKKAFIGRSSHVCTGEFLVNAGIRGKRIGRALMDCFLEWAPRLGFTVAHFSTIYETNTAARLLFEGAKFKRSGKLPNAGILKGMDHPVDLLLYTKALTQHREFTGKDRFERIYYYLSTGQYPQHADTPEKGRLRSAAIYYEIRDEKLYLKTKDGQPKEVISDPHKQLAITIKTHLKGHMGVNRATNEISQKYYWEKIKQTVKTVVSTCQKCRSEQNKPSKRFRTELAYSLDLEANVKEP